MTLKIVRAALFVLTNILNIYTNICILSLYKTVFKTSLGGNVSLFVFYTYFMTHTDSDGKTLNGKEIR
jgi:hypothetical protein